MNGYGTEEAVGHRDYVGSKVGMWLFLASEVLLFAGPFFLFISYRIKYPEGFLAGSNELSLSLGAANTMLLLTSSLTMALAIHELRRMRAGASVAYLAATAAMGLAFLGVKFFEWSGKIAHGIYPGSPELAAGQGGEAIFFGLYYFMAGIHALHVMAGVAVLAATAVMVRRGTVSSGDPVKIENAGLYWHLVDVIWIYIFQFFYIIG